MNQKVLLFGQIIMSLFFFAITFYSQATNNPGLAPQAPLPFQQNNANLNQPQPINRPVIPNTSSINQNFNQPPHNLPTRENLNRPQTLIDESAPFHSHENIVAQKTPKQPGKSNYKQISDLELQRILASLSQSDQKIISDIQKEISNWPEQVFKEVRDYNEFMIMVNRKAKEKYMKLSSSARQALETEQDLKKTLSPEAVGVLSKLNVK